MDITSASLNIKPLDIILIRVNQVSDEELEDFATKWKEQFIKANIHNPVFVFSGDVQLSTFSVLSL